MKKRSFTKMLALVMSLAMVFTLVSAMTLTASAAGTPTFTVETVEVEQGEGTANVDVEIKFAGEIALNTLQLDVEFDSALTAKAFVIGNTLPGITEPGLTGKKLTIPFSSGANDTALVEGNFATITFEVPVSEVKEFNIELVMVEAYDKADNDYYDAIATVPGKIVVKEAAEPEVPTVPTFTVETVEVEQGEGTADVAVEIKFAGEIALNTLQLDIEFDSALTAKAFVIGNTLPGITEPGLTGKKLTIPFSSGANDTALVEGNFATITFEVPVSEIKEFDIDLVMVEAYDKADNDYYDVIATVPGKIIVKEAEKPALEEKFEFVSANIVDGNAVVTFYNGFAEVKKPTVIVAVYDATGKMIAANKEVVDIAASNAAATAEVEVPAAGTVRVFAIDSLANLEAIGASK